jgi:hypothetical protein
MTPFDPTRQKTAGQSDVKQPTDLADKVEIRPETIPGHERIALYAPELDGNQTISASADWVGHREDCR